MSCWVLDFWLIYAAIFRHQNSAGILLHFVTVCCTPVQKQWNVHDRFICRTNSTALWPAIQLFASAGQSVCETPERCRVTMEGDNAPRSAILPATCSMHLDLECMLVAACRSLLDFHFDGAVNPRYTRLQNNEAQDVSTH